MRFGIFTSMGAQTWAGVLDFWRHLEATKWDVACVTDHFMPNTKEREGAMLESWSSLSALTALVPRMRVGTIVLGNTYRHPALVAKMAAQVDIISGGRLLLGLGAGWQQNEHEAYGIPFYTMRERLERLDEACQVMRSLWTEKRTTFKGHYYQLSDAPLDPKPVQTPHPELMIGGGGERVTLRIVAKHADHWNCWGGPGVLGRKGKILDEHCAATSTGSSRRSRPSSASGMPRPLGGQIQTVLGAIARDAIGITLPHEHLLIDFKVMFAEPAAASDKGRAWEPVSLANLGWVRQNFNANLDNLRLLDEQVAQDEISLFKQAGGRTVVDPTPKAIGRDPLALARIARATGLNVIMGAGYYVGASHPADMDRRTVDELTREMIADVTTGVGDTGVRAGLIGEIGTTYPWTDDARSEI